MMRKNALKKISALSLICTLLLSGCSFSGKMPDLNNYNLKSAYSGDAVVYRRLYAAEVANLNYLVTSSSVDTVICANTIDALVDYDSYGNIIPGLAESWESNDDMTEWTFHLRDDITWVDYNGEYYADVIADDWVMAAEYVNNAANETDCQYMYSTGSVVKNAQAYYDYTMYQMNPETYDEAPEKVEASDIGVSAPDEKTVVYELEQPCPFFPSVLSYTTYLPISRAYLDEVGDMFAKSNETVLYNGAYILHYFEPLEKQVLVKNPSYWDKENVFIDRVESYYDGDAASVGPQMYMDGQVDRAVVEPDKLSEYMSDEAMANEIHKSRPDSSFSYFYAFNFSPTFDEQYEPDNWSKAVVNESFRKAVMAAMDRGSVLSIYEPYDPEILLNNTITPFGAAVTSEGKDYTQFSGLSDISQTDSYDVAAAVSYRDTARSELEEAGVTFPIKVLMPYNPSTAGWEQEALLVEKQLESTLGEDFIDVIVEEGSETGFLLSIRMSGKYAFMKCRWGADYADPQTWTEPFEEDGEYMFWHESEDAGIKAVHDKWESMIEKASGISDDEDLRYEAFAEAEELIIDHAIVIPFSIMSGDGYIMDKVNEFEGEYSSYGMANQRYKLYKLNDKSMNLEEFDREYDKWINNR